MCWNNPTINTFSGIIWCPILRFFLALFCLLNVTSIALLNQLPPLFCPNPRTDSSEVASSWILSYVLWEVIIMKLFLLVSAPLIGIFVWISKTISLSLKQNGYWLSSLIDAQFALIEVHIIYVGMFLWCKVLYFVIAELDSYCLGKGEQIFFPIIENVNFDWCKQ